MSAIMVKGRSKAQIQELAEKMWEIFSPIIPTGSVYFPITQILEWAACPTGDEEPLFDLEIVPDDKLPGEYARYTPGNNTMAIRESVYIRAAKENPRDRFTLAHEFGHYLMHRHQAYSFARQQSDIPAYQDPEWQANTFASMLLMPRKLIDGMTVEEVMERCGTSRQAAQIALKK